MTEERGRLCSPTADRQLPIANRQLPIANCQLPVADCQLPIANCAARSAADLPPMSDDRFFPRTLTIDGETYRYMVYVPPGHDTAERGPVILFLHGAGERGSDGVRQTTVGLGPVVRADPEFPAVVVFPQLHPGAGWPGEAGRAAMRALDLTIEELALDERRVYLTGLSMGGNGSWHLALEHPARFAAVVPICGWIEGRWRGQPKENETLVERIAPIRDLPIWVFHGARDEVIPVGQSRLVVQALREAGARELRYTEYPEARHDSWTAAYAEPELWTWMLGKRRDA
jgi:predicted peptidase